MRVGFSVLLLLMLLLGAEELPGQIYQCPPTPQDADGPFYRPDAPVRNRIGSGYGLTGMIQSAVDCTRIGNARIEVWMAGPEGMYGDEWRATLFSRPDGRYYFSSHFPGRYGSRPPHIHLIVNAPGFTELITQHYMQPGHLGAVFNLVLIPAIETVAGKP
jgi:protocatechuate 3,4-dioxygenase beta subunit